MTPQKDLSHAIPAFVGGTKKNLIGGEWVDAASGRVIDVVNPANGRVLCEIAGSDGADVDRAVTAARSAFLLVEGIIRGDWI